eukprot:GHVR01060723.1.p1 GENE.GHVR01060723.1~~GHVR01060723.1.p1  ORF type:complete len:260 (-),score=75.02 GHVR01060723.1:462-1241(-)
MMNRAYVVTENNGIHCVDVDTGATLSSYQDVNGTVGCIRPIGYGSCYLASGQKNKALIKIWRAGGGVPCYTASLPRRATAIEFSCDGVLLISGHDNGNINIWHMGSGQLLSSFTPHSGCVRCLSLCASDAFIIIGYDDGIVNIYFLHMVLSIDGGCVSPLVSWGRHVMAVTQVVWRQTGDCLDGVVISSSLDRSVCMSNLCDNQHTHTIIFPSFVMSIAFCEVTDTLFCGLGSGSLVSVDINSTHTHTHTHTNYSRNYR